MVAIIPAAGTGTRMKAVTGGKPKELLRLGRSSVLGRVVQEARECDVDHVMVVSSPTKPELSISATEMGARVELQIKPLGLAHAIAAASVEDDAVILLGDCVFHGSSPAPRLTELIRKGIEGCIAVQEVDDSGTHLYGIVEVDEGTGGIKSILEKPGPQMTQSRWAVAGRFAFGVRLMAFISEYVGQHPPQEGRELGLTEVLQYAIAQGFDLKAVPLQPGQTRIDCGSPEEYAAARWLQWDDA